MNFYISDFIEFQVTPWFRNADFLEKKYVQEGLSTQQIADLVGSARSTVVRHLKAHKIPLRHLDKARQLHKAHLAYEERLYAGKIVSCKREQEVIAMIKNLRDQRLSLQAIANFLNRSGIPTKSRRAKWKPTTVWNLLKRYS
ncbi:MAG: recombinase family protein [Bdellovibrionota bacterium]